MSGGVAPEAFLRKTDEMKVDFDFRKSAWRVWYRTEPSCRKRRRLTDGFEIPETRPDGTVLSSDEFQRHIISCLKKARQAWNRLDGSTDARLPVDAEAGAD